MTRVETGTVRTVLGDVSSHELGYVQTHEHLFSDVRKYVDAPENSVMSSRRTSGSAEFDSDAFLNEPIRLDNYYGARWEWTRSDDGVLDSTQDAIAEMNDFRQAGGDTIIDPTPFNLGRNPEGVAEVSMATGVKVVMGVGYYIASFHPEDIASRAEESITEQFVEEIESGIPGTKIKTGLIGEIGMSWPTHPNEEKVLRGATRAQLLTGAPLMVHCGRSIEAPLGHCRSILAVGGDLSRTVLSHLDRTIFTYEQFEAVAKTGAIMSFDLFGEESSRYHLGPIDQPNDAQRINMIMALVDGGFEDQIVIAQDIARKTRLTKFGGEGYAHILRRVIPQMHRKGVTPELVQKITRENPRKYLSFL